MKVPLPDLAERLHGSIYGGNGYTFKDPWEVFRQRGVNLIYKVPKNMKPLLV